MEQIKQQHYPDLEIDNTEPDIIAVWQYGREESQVLHIERERVQEFINAIRNANSSRAPAVDNHRPIVINKDSQFI